MQKLSSSYSFNVEEKGKNRVMELDNCKTEEEAEELGEKKRRLCVEQVEAPEKKLVAEEKLDPEKKQRDLGQQPRQMAVQNCRKRPSKMKQRAQRDFDALKARHDALKLDCDAKRRQNLALISLVRKLESKLAESTGCEIETTGRLLQNYDYTDGASDTDSSSTLLNGAEANYGDQYCLLPEQPAVGSFSWCYSDMDDTD